MGDGKYRFGVWVAVLFTLALLLPWLRAQETEAPVRLDQVNTAEMLVKTARQGLYLPVPAVKTAISLQVRGIVARGTVHQTFENKSGHCIEAIYAFPLPENAAVDTLTMIVGNRTIEGVVKERAEAQKTYEQAKVEGKQASLLEQQRPNLFTVSISALPSGETAEIEIGYEQVLTYDSGTFSLRFPLAVGPRYQPEPASASPAVATTSTSGGAVAAPATAPDPAPLPVMDHQRTRANRNPVTIEVDLDAGIALQRIESPSHAIDTVMLSSTRHQVKLRDAQVASDRDFQLDWSPRLGAEPKAAVFSETVGGQRYLLSILFPPSLASKSVAVIPRETVFIIDTSGSMGGPSIEQARQALLMAIARLRPSDSFNVIEFNSTASRLFPRSRRADRDAVAEAKAWVRKLESTGGTEMIPALALALESINAQPGLRQVVFMTDGQVSNEQQLFDYLRAHLGNSRLFTVGIGAAPNSYFMRNAARFGRGTFTYIGNVSEVQQKMQALFAKLESPTLSNVQVAIAGSGAESYPQRTPDLYAGEPVVILARADTATSVTLRGDAAGERWSAQVDAGPAADTKQAGIARLWARQKIEALSDSLGAGANADEVRKGVLAVALEHHLVSDYTSLVAVDTTPAGTQARSCTPELVPLNLPAGWGGEDQGALPQGGTSGPLLILLGLLLLASALVVRRW
jgi:Ca-activated chloride channel family protein